MSITSGQNKGGQHKQYHQESHSRNLASFTDVAIKNIVFKKPTTNLEYICFGWTKWNNQYLKGQILFPGTGHQQTQLTAVTNLSH